MRLKGELIDPNKVYKVAGWAPVAEDAASAGHPMVWDLVEEWLKARGGKVTAREPNMPKLIGGVPNPGLAG